MGGGFRAGILFYRSGFLLLLLLLLLLLTFFRTILSLCLKSEIMDGFWSSRCLNDRLDLPDNIGSFLSDAATSMVVKNGTKKNFSPKKKKKKKISPKKKKKKKKKKK